MRRCAQPLVRLFVIVLVAGPAVTLAADRAPLRIAVAASAAPALRLIASQYEASGGDNVVLAVGSTGSLYTQIVNGAPFDLYLAADMARPVRAVKERRAAPGIHAVAYARGVLAAWIPDSRCRPDCMAALDTLDGRLAIADPVLAPYGVAAVACLHARNFNNRPTVVAPNVGVAFQYVASGNAPGGLVALSQLRLGEEAGRVKRADYSMVAPDCHPSLLQGAVVLRGPHRKAAESFLHYLLGPVSRKVFTRFGFRVPPDSP